MDSFKETSIDILIIQEIYKAIKELGAPCSDLLGILGVYKDPRTPSEVYEMLQDYNDRSPF